MPLIVGLRAHLAGLPSQVLLRAHRLIGRVQRGAVTAELQGARLEMQRQAAPTVLARLETLPGVRTVHTTSGRFDLIIGLEASNTEELDDTLDRIGEAKGVKGSESLIHLSTKIDRRG